MTAARQTDNLDFPLGSAELAHVRTRARAEAGKQEASAPSCRMGFVLFILVNATLFMRPAEMIPVLADWPIYEIIILCCLLASWPVVRERLTWRALSSSPATLCVVALIAPIFLSNLAHGNLFDARQGATQYLKIIIYFLLLVGLCRTSLRLQILLVAVVVFMTIISALAILEYHEIVDIPALAPLDQSGGAEDGSGPTDRLRGTGVFNDPNDMSLVLVVGMMIVGHAALRANRALLLRLAMVPAIAVLGYAFTLTQSRGGFLALLAAALTYIFAQFGRRRGIWLSALLLPVLLLIVAGRQTNIDLGSSDDTAQGRIQLWREGFELFRSSPIFGIGWGQFDEEVGHVAHNSYMHAFAELGLLGGIVFTACFYLPLSMLAEQVSRRRLAVSHKLQWWCPAILGILAGYAVGLFSLSRVYTVSTYVIVGIAVAFCGLMAAEQPLTMPSLSEPLVRRATVLSLGLLVAINVIVRVFAQ